MKCVLELQLQICLKIFDEEAKYTTHKIQLIEASSGKPYRKVALIHISHLGAADQK